MTAGLALATAHVAMGLAWSAVLIAAAGRARAQLRRPAVRRWTDRATGTVIGGFGVALLVERP